MRHFTNNILTTAVETLFRYNEQYSQEYKAKEVSEGEESKDFWNILGGKGQFQSLSEGSLVVEFLV